MSEGLCQTQCDSEPKNGEAGEGHNTDQLVVEEDKVDNQGDVRQKSSKVVRDKTEDEKPHAIALAIDSFILRVSDISFGASTFIPKAAKWKIDQIEANQEIISENLYFIDSENEIDNVIAMSNIVEASKKLDRVEHSELVGTLSIGLFLSLFSAFDAFTGELLTAIYLKKPELFNSINRSMSISEMLKYGKLDEIKWIILQNEIESFRRESYVEQFALLERKFDIKLKKFKNWSRFVECSQRRNLLTHCDGLISEQYIKICDSEGCKFGDDVKVGEKLRLTPDYIEKTCNIMIEVGLKLGQTLWRKLFEDELKSSEHNLQRIQYDFLVNEEWECAIMAGEFATNLQKYDEEPLRLIMVINYVLALAFSGNKKEASRVVDKENWSALCYDFKLAYQILKENYAEAGSIMQRIGRKGEYVFQHAYHDWPLFKYFRQTKEFLAAYNDIYGYPFAEELKRNAEENKVQGETEINKVKAELEDQPQIICAVIDEEQNQPNPLTQEFADEPITP